MKLRIVVLNDDLAPKNTLHIAQHGVSYYIEIQNENSKFKMLFDTGSSIVPIEYNASLSNIDLNTIQAIAISHCHYDHTGGLYDLIKNKNIPVFANPNIFRENFYLPYRYIGIPKQHLNEIKNYSNLILVKEKMEIFENIFFTGEIPRENSFETVSSMYTIIDGNIVKDEMLDDSSLYIDLGDGLFLISGCSHAGIVNIKNYAEKISGKKVKYILGGLHLLDASDDRIKFTVENLKNIKLYLGHCTGERAIQKFTEAYGNKVTRIYSGFEVIV